jgi:hypothetical protein
MQMRRTTTMIATLLLALGLVAAPAMADEHGSPFDTPHPHALLLHADVLDQPDPNTGAPYTVLGYGKCVDLAGGKALRQNNFHTNIHFGQAGQALRGAGHLIVPFFDCATLDGYFGY